MEGIHAVSGGVGASSPTGRPGTSGSYNKRKRSGVEFESSPGSGGEGDDDDQAGRRQPGVKRACNECRQQKVSHSPWRAGWNATRRRGCDGDLDEPRTNYTYL
jgi:hypothetical protein